MNREPFVAVEINSQPECWRQAATLAATAGDLLPEPHERVAVIGCGTSWFVGQAYAALREARGLGETDAFVASEAPSTRRYDRWVAISRSGTTSEVISVLERLRGEGAHTTVVTADPATPVADMADSLVVLEFADEQAVVQTRFATSVLALLRVHCGDDLAPALSHIERILAEPLLGEVLRRRHYVFLGQGWSVGLAHEAALKIREASLAWAESYPAMDYRHGPISVAGKDTVVWSLGGNMPPGLADEIENTGAFVVADTMDPMTDLVRIQRIAVALGTSRGLDPDRPRHLRRSVVLDAG